MRFCWLLLLFHSLFNGPFHNCNINISHFNFKRSILHVHGKLYETIENGIHFKLNGNFQPEFQNHRQATMILTQISDCVLFKRIFCRLHLIGSQRAFRFGSLDWHFLWILRSFFRLLDKKISLHWFFLPATKLKTMNETNKATSSYRTMETYAFTANKFLWLSTKRLTCFTGIVCFAWIFHVEQIVSCSHHDGSNVNFTVHNRIC